MGTIICIDVGSFTTQYLLLGTTSYNYLDVNTFLWVILFPTLAKYYYRNIKILEYWLNNLYVPPSFKLR